MNYATIVQEIQYVANAVLGDGVGLFHYGRTPQHAENYNGPMPQIHLDPLTDTPNYANATTRVSISLGFLNQDEAGTDAAQQAAIVNAMQLLSDRFMIRLGENELYEEVTANRKPIYQYSKARLTGVMITFTLTVPLSLCY